MLGNACSFSLQNSSYGSRSTFFLSFIHVFHILYGESSLFLLSFSQITCSTKYLNSGMPTFSLPFKLNIFRLRLKSKCCVNFSKANVTSTMFSDIISIYLFREFCPLNRLCKCLSITYCSVLHTHRKEICVG